VVTDRLVWSQNVGSILDLALQLIEVGKLERNKKSSALVKKGKIIFFVCKMLLQNNFMKVKKTK